MLVTLLLHWKMFNEMIQILFSKDLKNSAEFSNVISFMKQRSRTVFVIAKKTFFSGHHWFYDTSPYFAKPHKAI